jgi:hypothetical protein
VLCSLMVAFEVKTRRSMLGLSGVQSGVIQRIKNGC